MTDEPTAWEEINPVTVSAQRREPPSRCSAPNEDRITFRNELTACLTLTAPVGMTEENRRDWLAVAWDSLKHIPADILISGARKAREKCDHPSKIVPTIIAETAETMGRRSRLSEWDHSHTLALPRPKQHVADRDRRYFKAEDWADLNEYLERMGSPARYHADGTRYLLSPGSKPDGRDHEEGLDREATRAGIAPR